MLGEKIRLCILYYIKFSLIKTKHYKL